MYKYAETQRVSHAVHVDGGRAFKIEACNLDDARYFSLQDERPPGKPHCKHCDIPKTPAQEAERAEREKAEERVPALGKNDVPRSLLVVPKRLAALLLLAVAAVPFLAGSASGVVLSPDDERGGTNVSPTPSCDPATLEGCGDLVIIIEKLVDQQLLAHLEIDHAPEVSPSATPSIGSGSSPMASASASATSTPIATARRPTSTPRIASPTTAPRRTPRPTPIPTARPVDPSPVPTCFRPGNSQGGKDPCAWPPDD